MQERARTLGYGRLYLETGPKQPEAVALYHATGWELADLDPERYGYRFTKELGGPQ